MKEGTRMTNGEFIVICVEMMGESKFCNTGMSTRQPCPQKTFYDTMRFGLLNQKSLQFVSHLPLLGPFNFVLFKF